MKNNINQKQTTGLKHFSPKRFAFHKNYSPRRWTRLVVLRRRLFLQEPRPMFRSIVLQEDGTPRPNFALWVNKIPKNFQNIQIHNLEDMRNKILENNELMRQIIKNNELICDQITKDNKPTHNGFAKNNKLPDNGFVKENELMRDKIINNNELMRVKTITIMATKHVEYNARVMERWLSVLDIRVQVVIGNISEFDDDLYIVLCPQAFIVLPPPMKRIIFQLEQSSRSDWFTDEYMDTLMQSLAVFDYSSDNVQYLQDNGISYRDIFELTIAPITDYMPPEKPVEKSRDFDVLFYGAYNERRNRILKRLRKKFRVKSVAEVYGDEMRDIIRQAPVVVNIHFYENALLESERLANAVSLGTRVVSERGSDEDKNRDFESCVRFCPMNDVDALIAAIKEELADAKQTPAPTLPIDFIEQASFRFYRGLLALGMIDYDKFYTLMDNWKLPSNKIMLGLPENVTRREYAMTQIPKDVDIFDGLRHRIGWIGCGMSYKYMAQKALDAGFENLQIHEDDAKFPDNYDKSYPVVKEYLAIHKNKWNLFSGMIVVLRDIENIKILDVANYKGLTFVRLNYFTSTVYGIYKGSFLKNMAQYPIQLPSQLSDDDIASGGTHTIDVYLNKLGVECITTLPFMMNQWSDGDSTLWGMGNQEVDQLYKRCQIQMYDLVKKFKKES